MPGLRVVLDTNVLASGLAYPGNVPGHIVTTWRQGGLDVVLSRHILDKLVRVLPHLPRIRMMPAEIRDLADIVESEGEQGAKLHDPTGQPVLLTLLAAKADYLITGGKDLLALPILAPAVFWTRHGG